MTPIAFNRLALTASDHAAASAVLESGWLADGPETARLEVILSDLFGVVGACCTASGSTALHLAQRGLGLRGARVAMPSYLCSAVLDAVILAGNVPVIVDVAPDVPSLAPESIEQARRSGTLDAVIDVHTFGWRSSLAPRTKGLIVIEDCCHAIGGIVDGEMVGSHSDVAITSFYPTKPIASGGGGAVWSSDAGIVERMRDLLNPSSPKSSEPRLNNRISDLHAAIAVSQLDRLVMIRKARQEIVDRYEAATPVWLEIVTRRRGHDLMPYRFVLLARDDAHRARLFAHFDGQHIGTSRLLRAEEALHRRLGLPPAAFPNTEAFTSRSVALPLHLLLSTEDVDRVCAALETSPD